MLKNFNANLVFESQHEANFLASCRQSKFTVGPERISTITSADLFLEHYEAQPYGGETPERNYQNFLSSIQQDDNMATRGYVKL